MLNPQQYKKGKEAGYYQKTIEIRHILRYNKDLLLKAKFASEDKNINPAQFGTYYQELITKLLTIINHIQK